MNALYEDTIAANATALASSGIGIIRVSGPEAIKYTDMIFRGRSELSSAKTYTIHYGKIVEPESGEELDEVLVSVMRAPHSYTAEDVCEINCHGGILVIKRVLSLLYRLGVRPAEPGEFTKRAFLNGRIDLSQAESVMDIIESGNEKALKNSLGQLSGRESDKIKDLRSAILHETAYIESALDDPEHYSLEGYSDLLTEHVQKILSDIRKMIASFSDGIIIKEGIMTAIAGRPNVGKSSLLNFLTHSDRAIVSDIPGTTRDVIEEQVNLGELTLNLIDTAGIRTTDDTIEKVGVDRAKKSIEQADLVLFLLDSSDSITDEDKKIFESLSDKKKIVLLNKSDKISENNSNMPLTVESISKIFGSDIDSVPVISISAKNGDGIDDLKNAIEKMFLHGDLSSSDDFYITSVRQKDELESAAKSLELVLESISNQMPEDFYTVDLMDAYTSLGRILGLEVEDDLVDRIFSEFCMGK